jgi:hypothetical protein
MKEPKKSLKTESSGISTTAEGAGSESVENVPDLPPRGSALNIETALTFARKGHKLANELQKVDPCNAYMELTSFLSVVIEQLEEVTDKMKRQSKLAAH